MNETGTEFNLGSYCSSASFTISSLLSIDGLSEEETEPRSCEVSMQGGRSFSLDDLVKERPFANFIVVDSLLDSALSDKEEGRDLTAGAGSLALEMSGKKLDDAYIESFQCGQSRSSMPSLSSILEQEAIAVLSLERNSSPSSFSAGSSSLSDGSNRRLPIEIIDRVSIGITQHQCYGSSLEQLCPRWTIKESHLTRKKDQRWEPVDSLPAECKSNKNNRLSTSKTGIPLRTYGDSLPVVAARTSSPLRRSQGDLALARRVESPAAA
jgi:hypothetical protein